MEQTQGLPNWVKTQLPYTCAMCKQPMARTKGPSRTVCPHCGAEYTSEGLREWC